MLHSTSVVNKLKVHSTEPDSIALRLTIERQLSSVDFRIPGAPPSGILLVRKLDDPLPGRITTNSNCVIADQAWQQAVQSQLAHYWQNAVRQKNGIIKRNAEAIWFIDEAELKACVALSVAESAITPWWGKTIASQFNYSDITDLFNHDIQQLPGVVSLLEQWQKTEEVIKNLSPVLCMELTSKVSRMFDLPLTGGDIACFISATSENNIVKIGDKKRKTEPYPTKTASKEEKTDTVSNNTAFSQQKSTAYNHEATPWSPWWKHGSQSMLQPAQQFFIAITLGIQRAPAQVRKPDFIQDVISWVTSSETHKDDAFLSKKTRDTMPVPANQSNKEPENIKFKKNLKTRETDAKQTGDTKVSNKEPSEKFTPAKVDNVYVIPQTKTSKDNNEFIADSDIDRSYVPATQTSKQDKDTNKSPSSATDTSTNKTATPEEHSRTPDEIAVDSFPIDWGTDGLETHIGGLFFLINLLEFLDLPGHFESQCHPDNTVSTPAILETITHALCDELSADIQQDPIWSLFALLDGRKPGAPPAAENVQLDELSLPSTWIEQLNESSTVFKWQTDKKQLYLWNKDLFPVAEIKLDKGSVERQVAASVRRCCPEKTPFELEKCTNSLATPKLETLHQLNWPSSLTRWAEFVTPFIRYRLCRALGNNQPDECNCIEELIHCSGKIYLTETHIDFVSCVNSVQLTVRLAGLDRSPGWIPRLGRVILFHFE